MELLDATDPLEYSQWEAVWREWPQREVFAHPGYARLYATASARPLCALWRADGVTVLYPFMYRELSAEPYWCSDIGAGADITSPYGYGGPFVWGDVQPTSTAAKFWGAFDSWTRDRGVISEFIRFSLFPKTLLEYPGNRVGRLVNVVRNLEVSADALWMDFEHKVRKNVNKARRMGVRIEFDPTGARLESFMKLYQGTMQRRGADARYYFTEEYFNQIVTDMPGQFAFFHALHEDRLVSSELVLVSADNVYSFLGGTYQDAFDLRPNDLLKFEIILWAKQQGKKNFVLGGGHEGEDGIFKYKLAFAPNGRFPFTVGRRVINEALYQRLVERRFGCMGSFPDAPTDYFPAYRA